MKKEVIVKAATVDAAVEKAAIELGVDAAKCKVEILEAPKKSFFGRTKEAVVKVLVDEDEEAEDVVKIGDEVTTNESNKLAIATAYLQSILDAMSLSNVTMSVKENKDGAVITFNGEEIAVLIGHHGETLDAMQYLVALTCNRIDGEYYRITLDCGDYRVKREATLAALAARIANKVKKSGRSQLLEPMNPYERRIIHAVVSDIEGVYSKSKGEEPNRRVVIFSETPVKVNFNKNTNRKDDSPKKPYVHKPERTMEEILKSDFKNKEQSAELYSKVKL